MILSEDSITPIMFLNYSTGDNQIVGKVNDNYIIAYGHLEERYAERVEKIYNVTKDSALLYDNMITRGINVTQNKCKQCMPKSNEKERLLVTSKIQFECEDGKHFIIDVSLLISRSKVLWSKDYPNVPLPMYEKLYRTRKIKIGDQIYAFETMVSTVRMQGEQTMNFNEYKVIDKFNMPNVIYKVTKQEMYDITEHMLKDKETRMSKKALKMIRTYRSQLGIIAN